VTLTQAFHTYPVAGIDHAMLHGQEAAFEECVAFFSGMEKTHRQNRRRTSYRLKHIVEKVCKQYVYEGTLILAGAASGFEMEQKGRHLKATFNYAERSLLKTMAVA
jgi:hypothetical protein